jgi:homoserine O-acetyltransferase
VNPLDIDFNHRKNFYKCNSCRRLLCIRKIFSNLSAQYFHYKEPFELECGKTLPGITIAYHTYGELAADGNNAVWVCHALTASSAAAEWWPGVVGNSGIIKPAHYFIVCANILGSCYGTTGPASINPASGQPWYDDFPLITIRDMVKAHILLREHLRIVSFSHFGSGKCMGNRHPRRSAARYRGRSIMERTQAESRPQWPESSTRNRYAHLP